MMDLRERLKARLAPAESWRPGEAPPRSDYDLNEAFERAGGPLKQAAVLVPIVARPEGATVILTRRADTLSSHTGQIAFPGGRLDPGETPVQAALREAWEEIRLAPGAVEPLGLSDGYETVTGFCVTPVIGWVRPDAAMQAQPDEVADIFEVPWDFLMDAANHRRESFEPPGGGGRRWFWAMPFGERYIWGATAGMLRGLSLRLQDRAEDAA